MIHSEQKCRLSAELDQHSTPLPTEHHFSQMYDYLCSCIPSVFQQQESTKLVFRSDYNRTSTPSRGYREGRSESFLHDFLAEHLWTETWRKWEFDWVVFSISTKKKTQSKNSIETLVSMEKPFRCNLILSWLDLRKTNFVVWLEGYPESVRICKIHHLTIRFT